MIARPRPGPTRPHPNICNRPPVAPADSGAIACAAPRPVTGTDMGLEPSPSPLDCSLTKDRVTAGPSTTGGPAARAWPRPRLADRRAASEAAYSRAPQPRPLAALPHPENWLPAVLAKGGVIAGAHPHARPLCHRCGRRPFPSLFDHHLDGRRVIAHPCPAPAAMPARVGAVPGWPTAAPSPETSCLRGVRRVPGRLAAPPEASGSRAGRRRSVTAAAPPQFARLPLRRTTT